MGPLFRRASAFPLAGALIAVLIVMSRTAHADQVEYTGYMFGDVKDNNVATTAFSLAKTLWDRTVVLLDVELDQVTVPAVLDGTTGASRPRRKSTQEFRKSRGQVIAGLEQALGSDTRAAANYYFSQELDYASQAVIGTLTQELLQKNVTLSVRGQYTWDQVGEITETGALINRFKETHQAAFTLTQLLSPTTILQAGGDAFRLKGFLSDPYLPHVHPNERWRQAAWTELRQYLRGLDGSLALQYRYYWDDWNVAAHTTQLKLNKYLSRDVVLSPWYRYYIQTQADFYGKPATEQFHSTDYKLSSFESNTMGADVTWYLRSLGRTRKNLDFLANASVSFMSFYYFNTNDFSCDVMQAKVNFTY